MTQIIKGIGTLHTPQFAVHGKARKELIKERNSLRSFIKGFAYHNTLHNDMCSFYGTKGRINKEEENEILIKAQAELDELNNKLAEPYKQQ